jgi:hypothetical protein
MMIKDQLPAQALKYFGNTLSSSKSISTCPMGPQIFIILAEIQVLQSPQFDKSWYIAGQETR